MRALLHGVFLLLLAVLLTSGCTESVNYDIEEVAPAEFLSGEEEPCDDESCTDPDHVHDEHGEDGTCTDPDHDHGVSGEHGDHDEGAGITETGEMIHDLGLHQHGAGVRNHGTEWFFNQPWAASFVWGKMLRDSIILLALAASVVLLPRLLRKRRRQ